MTENYVLCELLKSEFDTPCYWTSGNSAEVDFVIGCGKHIVPIEVKSERNVKSRSLNEYRKKYEPAYSVKVSMINEVCGEDLLNVPLYLVSNLEVFINE